MRTRISEVVEPYVHEIKGHTELSAVTEVAAKFVASDEYVMKEGVETSSRTAKYSVPII